MIFHAAASAAELSLARRVRKGASRFALATTIAVILPCVGCGSGTQQDLGQVQGVITLDGAPLANAQVVFSPDGGRPSTGITDAAGKYTLTYIRDTMGAKIGHHSVRIESVPTTTIAPGKPEGVQTLAETIPAKYNAESTLSAEVKSGENSIDFPLVSK